MLALLSLFLVSFLAATLLPLYSEVLFGVLLLRGHDPVALWAVATAGNTLGAVVNWALARFLLRYQDRPWFPFPADGLSGAQRWFQRYGKWSLLLSWAPVGGDALTFVAGLMRVRIAPFLLLVGVGKGARYAVLLALLGAFAESDGEVTLHDPEPRPHHPKLQEFRTCSAGLG